MITSKSDKAFNFFTKTWISLFTAITVFLVLLIFMVSITDEKVIQLNGYSLFPEKLSLAAYKTILTDDTFFRSLGISLSLTFLGTVAAVFLTALCGYGLSHPNIKYKNHIAMFFYISMVFNAGLVPWYLVCYNLGLYENYWALLIPSMFSTYNSFLVRNYMRGIDKAIRESAVIDGANDFRIAFQIYFPLSKPVLATVSLFYSIGYWNNWYNAVMLAPSNKDIYPLQYLLFKLQADIEFAQQMIELGLSQYATPPAESFKMATAILTMGPIVIIYPFLQKHIVKGVIVGGVKG